MRRRHIGVCPPGLEIVDEFRDRLLDELAQHKAQHHALRFLCGAGTEFLRVTQPELAEGVVAVAKLDRGPFLLCVWDAVRTTSVEPDATLVLEDRRWTLALRAHRLLP